MDDQEREMEAYSILRGETEVGALACYPDTCEDEIQALTAAGLTVRPMEGEEVAGESGDLKPIDAECSADNHDACDISMAVAWVRDLASDTGTAAPEVQELLATGYRDKEQVIEVLSVVRDRLPETATVDGEEIQPRMASEQAIGLVRGEWSIDDMPDAEPAS
jgi:hypothetical protein